jgi:hypothetical protein
MFSVPKGEEKFAGLYASAISPIIEELASFPLSNRAVTVSMMDELSPVSWSSGCLAAPWLPLVVEERID